MGHQTGSGDTLMTPVGDIDQKLADKVCENLTQHQNFVSNPNEGLEAHPGQPIG